MAHCSAELALGFSTESYLEIVLISAFASSFFFSSSISLVSEHFFVIWLFGLLSSLLFSSLGFVPWVCTLGAPFQVVPK